MINLNQAKVIYFVGALAYSHGGIFEGLQSLSYKPQVYIHGLFCNGTENNLNDCNFEFSPKFVSLNFVSRSEKPLDFFAAGVLCSHEEIDGPNFVKILGQKSHKKGFVFQIQPETKQLVNLLDFESQKNVCLKLGYENVQFGAEFEPSLQTKFEGNFSLKCVGSSQKYFDFECPRIEWKGDGICDDVNNVEICQFDGGDCCQTLANFQFCKECHCFVSKNAFCTF